MGRAFSRPCFHARLLYLHKSIAGVKLQNTARENTHQPSWAVHILSVGTDIRIRNIACLLRCAANYEFDRLVTCFSSDLSSLKICSKMCCRTIKIK